MQILPAKLTLAELYNRPDQEAAEADLKTFFRRRSRFYLDLYELGRDGGMLFWSGAAFSGWFLWYWYRRMWVEGAIALAVPVAAGWLAGLVAPRLGYDYNLAENIVGILAYIPVVLAANRLYLASAARAIGNADAAGLAGEERVAFLRAQGGVSSTGLTIGLLILMVLAAPQVRQLMDQWNEIKGMLDQIG